MKHFAIALLFLALMCLTFALGAQGQGQSEPSREQCPNGYHYVQPPCYYDANGYRVCPQGYWVCN